jgi:hypothetical protein
MTNRQRPEGGGGTLARHGEQAAFADLEIFRRGYPRAFFFRHSEYFAAGRYGYPALDYPQWEETFLPLNGIMGKVLSEELDHTDKRNLEYFLRFKERHPGKAVLLHYNGNARLPTHDTEGFFAGHWLYAAGTHLTQDVDADNGTAVLHVADPAIFHLGIGRFDDQNDDIGVAIVSDDGKPDWRQAEQVKLVAIDHARRTITVARGAYGTKPRAFPAGSYLAPHMVEGPWDRGHPLSWLYNISTAAPRDAHGRNASDALLEDLVAKFGLGGPLAAFDGLEFDAFRSTLEGPRGLPDADTDNDGIADAGIIANVNSYLLGRIAFTEALRARLPDKLIMADGWSAIQRLAYPFLNGIESEGWPSLPDYEVVDWSGGLNRHAFWAHRGLPPRLSYINHKYNTSAEERQHGTTVNYANARLVLAAAQFTDSAFAYLIKPAEGERVFGVFDELWQGTDHRANWLGMPLGPAVHLAEESSDLLGGKGVQWDEALIARFLGEGVAFARQTGRLVITAAGADSSPRRETAPGSLPVLPPLARVDDPMMTFTLPRVTIPGEDLYIALTVQAAPLVTYPGIGRRITVRATPRTATAGAIESFTLADDSPFVATFFFRSVGPGFVDLTFQIEGDAPLTVERLTMHAAADAMYRAFEYGAVFANPSTRPYTFDIQRLLPGASFRRLRGAPDQDPATNNGALVGETLTIGPKDALFVQR